MSLPAILAAIDEQLATVDFPADNIAFLNATYVPVAEVPYLRASMAAQKMTPLTLGADKSVAAGATGYTAQWSGIYNVDCVWPQDAGAGGCYNMQQTILNLFPRGLTLTTTDGVLVHFDTPSALVVRPDSGAWARGPVQCPWWALVTS